MFGIRVVQNLTSTTWDAQLQMMCMDTGLIGRFTSYSFRRGTITVWKQRHGMCAAQDLAGHLINGVAIHSYVRQPLQNLDIPGLLAQGIIRIEEEIRQLWTPAKAVR